MEVLGLKVNIESQLILKNKNIQDPQNTTGIASSPQYVES